MSSPVLHPPLAERRSPLHSLFLSRGAVFDGTCGWRYPIWFRTQETPTADLAYQREQNLIRTKVGVADCSVLTQILVAGPGALAMLNRLSTSDCDVKVGKVVYTQWCDDDGKILVDAVVTRHELDRFILAINDTSQVEALSIAMKAAAVQEQATIVVDITSAIASMVVAGPLARDVLAPLIPSLLSSEAFPPLTSQELPLLGAPVTVTRVSYVGEVCFELHIPAEYAFAVGSAVLEAAEQIDGGAVGIDTLYALGTEHGMFDFDYNIGRDVTPLEAGIGFTICWTKPEGFRGDRALEQQCVEGVKQRLLFVHNDLHTDDLAVGNAVLRNSLRVGSLITVDPCHHVGRNVGASLVSCPVGFSQEWLESGEWMVQDESGQMHPVAVTTRALYDPLRKRSKI